MIDFDVFNIKQVFINDFFFLKIHPYFTVEKRQSKLTKSATI